MTRTPPDDPYARDPYAGIDPDEPDGGAEHLDRLAEAPLDGRTADPVEERAERRGLGKGLALGLAAAALIALAVLWLVTWGPMRPQPAPDNTTPVTTLPADATSGPTSVTNAPPSDTGPASAPGQPTATADAEQPVQTPAASASGSLEVALSRWGWVPGQRMIAAAALVPSVVESGGTCTLTATSGSTSLTATADASADAHATVCAVNLQDPGLVPGVWQVVVAYEGPSGSGTSAPGEVTVS